ncbi:MAG: hypothetical protein Q8S09_12235 [Hyphomonas sp.]|nr:hypothetical protein [Hyphomonas sp.]
MTRRNNILDFRRRHRIEKPQEPPRPSKRQPWWRRIGSRTNDMWGPYYRPFGFRTWMFLTGIVPVLVLFAVWSFGWTEPLESYDPVPAWLLTPED